MLRRRGFWVLGALVLFAIAAGLMSWGDPAPAEPEKPRVEMPRAMGPKDRERLEQRRAVVAALRQALPSASPPVQAPPRDPMMAMLPTDSKAGVMVIEANAIRHSPIGELLIECITSRDDGRSLQQFRDETGIDPLKDLDRVAISDGRLVLSGNFTGAKWDQVFEGNAARKWGEHGRIVERANKDGSPVLIGIWKDQLVFYGKNVAELEESLDRVEGRKPMAESMLKEEQSYGDIYGVLKPEFLAGLLKGRAPEAAEQLKKVAEQVELHIDTTRDVGLVTEVRGSSSDEVQDLGKTLGGLLSMARLKAQSDGDERLSELLDFAKVSRQGGGPAFRLEVGLPYAYLEGMARSCVEENHARTAKRDGGR